MLLTKFHGSHTNSWQGVHVLKVERLGGVAQIFMRPSAIRRFGIFCWVWRGSGWFSQTTDPLCSMQYSDVLLFRFIHTALYVMKWYFMILRSYWFATLVFNLWTNELSALDPLVLALLSALTFGADSIDLVFCRFFFRLMVCSAKMSRIAAVSL